MNKMQGVFAARSDMQARRRKAQERRGIPGEPAAGTGFDRRQLLSGFLAVPALSALGLAASLGIDCAAAQESSETLQKIAEIVSKDKKLRAILKVLNTNFNLPGAPAPTMLRYFEGSTPDGVVWPPSTAAGMVPPVRPGPTLRARVGDLVEISFFNHVTPEFSASFDKVETGQVEACDSSVGSDGAEIYPKDLDTGPNCFHGSTTTNIHFHGTHVTPDGLGDNVLLQLRADPDVDQAVVEKYFQEIFSATENGGAPRSWEDLPQGWRDLQLFLLREHDYLSAWQGERGKLGGPALPEGSQLLPETETLIRRGAWPQHQIGAYPHSFQLTPYLDDEGRRTKFEMGQAPGTHWYHAHKHGSTAINVFNGMAGVFIIEGDYDDKLRTAIPGLKEKVLIVQQYKDKPNLFKQTSGAPPLVVNGDSVPLISMRPGEVQLWRLVNATVQSVTTLFGFTGAGAVPSVRQTAQDGVQFAPDNFESQPFLSPIPAARFSTFAPGNRVDLLVQAPAERGGPHAFRVEANVDFGSRAEADLLQVMVEGDPMEGMALPDKNNFPPLPEFLNDLKEEDVRIRRTIDFTMKDSAPNFGMDGAKFRGDRYDQTMVLGDVEEWTIRNLTDIVAHPFHIHVNPFQVVEIFDPDPASQKRYGLTKQFVWQDAIAIPAMSGGVPGHVRIRHKFADFTGSYVMHCHILAHEDRGMMQLIRVIASEGEGAIVPHH